jgi:AraC-like DNA-binding protein
MRTFASRERITLDMKVAGVRDVVMVGRYQYRRAQPPLLRHVHRGAFEIVALESGQQIYRLCGQSYTLSGGDVFVTKPDEIHDTGGEPQSKGRLYWMQFCDVKPGRSFLGLPVGESRQLSERLWRLTPRQFGGGALLTPTFERIIAAYMDASQSLRTANLQNLLLRLILDVVELAGKAATATHATDTSRALQMIEADLGAALHVEELAQAAGMSVSHFKTCFKRDTGVPPAEYIKRRRITEARHQLATSAKSVTTIAHALGFQSSQHFATVFRRFTGLTPLAFRRHHADQAANTPVIAGTGTTFNPIAAPLKK